MDTTQAQCPFSGLRTTDVPNRWSSEDPFDDWEKILSENRVWWDEEVQTWIVTGYDEVVEVLNDPTRFSSNFGPHIPSSPDASDFERILNASMVVAPDDRRRELRRVAGRGTSQRNVERMTPMVVETVDGLLEAAADLPQINWIDDIARSMPSIVVGSILGFTRSEMEAFTDLVRDTLSLIDPRIDADSFERAAKAVEEMGRRVAVKIGASGTGSNGEYSLIESLAEAEHSGDLTSDETIGVAVMMVLGGVETTAMAAGHGLLTLLDNDPDRWVTDEEADIEDVVEEVLRYAAVSKGATRWVMADTELGGQKLAVGDRVTISFGAASRDPRTYEDHGEFLPTRDQGRMIAFGHGTRFCLGQAIARLELKVLFSRLADYDITVVGPVIYDEDHPIMRQMIDLPVKVTRR